jgi:hypothetical protein
LRGISGSGPDLPASQQGARPLDRLAALAPAIFAERESHAACFLQEQRVTRYDAINYISDVIIKRGGDTAV